jgi:hypothetical protein
MEAGKDFSLKKLHEEKAYKLIICGFWELFCGEFELKLSCESDV